MKKLLIADDHHVMRQLISLTLDIPWRLSSPHYCRTSHLMDYPDETRPLLRCAQKSAVAQRRNVCVTLGGTTCSMTSHDEGGKVCFPRHLHGKQWGCDRRPWPYRANGYVCDRVLVAVKTRCAPIAVASRST